MLWVGRVLGILRLRRGCELRACSVWRRGGARVGRSPVRIHGSPLRGEAAADGERQGATALSALQRVPPLRSWETPEESLTPRALDEMNNDGDP